MDATIPIQGHFIQIKTTDSISVVPAIHTQGDKYADEQLKQLQSLCGGLIELVCQDVFPDVGIYVNENGSGLPVNKLALALFPSLELRGNVILFHRNPPYAHGLQGELFRLVSAAIDDAAKQGK